MKLATGAGYWSAGPPDGAQEMLLQAEELGFHSFWTAEAYGSDALTPLAWWGSQTSTIQLGTGIVQISARTNAVQGRPTRAWYFSANSSSQPVPRANISSQNSNRLMR